MRTINQIRKASKTLKQGYVNQVKIFGYKENLGDKYMNKFNKFVGDEYSYSYFDRLEINKIHSDLFNTVVSPI